MSHEIQKHITDFFQVQQLLGSGAYGHVWKVVQKSTQKTYALKKVFDAFQNNIDAQRTYRQITILHQIDNPNIIKLKSVIKAKNDQDLYLVFEHMETDLHSLVGQNILEMPHILYIVYQIFKALKYLHSAQLIHRDLKPSNILINSQCEIKLCDFGLVRSLAHDQSQRLILSQDVATRWYRSPQMLLGSEEYGWPTDVWSIGCILAELMIGEPIMMGKSNIEQLEKILQLTGIPKPEDIHSLKSKVVAKGFFNQFNVIKRPFKHYFKGTKFQTQFELINLIKSMLEFDPSKRITVNQVLEHHIFADLRCVKEEVICKRFIVPKLDDNLRLSLEEYRNAIYKDVERRYPQYNLEPVQEKSCPSIFRFKRTQNSLLNKSTSIDQFPKAMASNSLMRGNQKKQTIKKVLQGEECKNLQNRSNWNTFHSSNLHKKAEPEIKANQQSHNSFYQRINLFHSIDNNKQNNREKNDLNNLIQKSPYRRYKKSNQKFNPLQQMQKIVGLTYSKEKNSQKENNHEEKENFGSYSPLTKSQLMQNPSKVSPIGSGMVKNLRTTNLYNASPNTTIKRRENNLYKISEVSNQNKIIKKTLTRARKEFVSQMGSENKNTSIHKFPVTKIIVEG